MPQIADKDQMNFRRIPDGDRKKLRLCNEFRSPIAPIIVFNSTTHATNLNQRSDEFSDEFQTERGRSAEEARGYCLQSRIVVQAGRREQCLGISEVLVQYAFLKHSMECSGIAPVNNYIISEERTSTILVQVM
jgi:hypothetical protein